MKESFPQTSPEGATQPERIRISVSNLVNRVRVTETGEVFQVVMRNKKAWEEKGERKYQALGGAAKMSPEGKQALVTEFGAQFGRVDRPDEESDDARFFVDTGSETPDEKLEELLDRFSAQDPAFFETEVLREAHEDLVGTEAAGLTEAEFQDIRSHYLGAISPVPWKTTTSEREISGIPSRRIFHLFELEVPQALVQKLVASETLRVLSSSDIEDINEATGKGNPAARLKDGSVVVENIFPETV